MRLTLAAGSALGGVAKDGLRLAGLPVVEAVPAELVGGADLIGESERIDPALLLRSPTAVPREFDHSRLPTTVHCEGANEVGATRACIHAQPLDDPLGMGVQELVDEADYLDARHIPHERDRRRFGAGCKSDHVSLEALRRARARQDLGIEGHGRNISGRRRLLGPPALWIRTKLAIGSAHWGALV